MVDAVSLKNAGNVDLATFTDLGKVPEPVSCESGPTFYQNEDKFS